MVAAPPPVTEQARLTLEIILRDAVHHHYLNLAELSKKGLGVLSDGLEPIGVVLRLESGVVGLSS